MARNAARPQLFLPAMPVCIKKRTLLSLAATIFYTNSVNAALMSCCSLKSRHYQTLSPSNCVTASAKTIKTYGRLLLRPSSLSHRSPPEPQPSNPVFSKIVAPQPCQHMKVRPSKPTGLSTQTCLFRLRGSPTIAIRARRRHHPAPKPSSGCCLLTPYRSPTIHRGFRQALCDDARRPRRRTAVPRYVLADDPIALGQKRFPH